MTEHDVEPAGGNASKLYNVLACALLAYLLVGGGFPQPAQQPAAEQEQDLYGAVSALVTPHGYPLEEHFVTTPDGYILRMFRLPAGRAPAAGAGTGASPLDATAVSGCGARCNQTHSGITPGCSVGPQVLPATGCPCGGGARGGAARATGAACGRAGVRPTPGVARPVVLLQHALMDSAAGFLLLGPGRALALQLADAGFDVWLANSRGNRFSRNHTRLSPDEAGFWRFSVDHMAAHDIPAMVDMALSVSGQPSLVLVGYSQGTLLALAALSSQPRLARRVSLAALLAPVAIVSHMRSAPFVLTSLARLDAAVLAAGGAEWGAHAPGAARACERAPRLCLGLLTALCGANPRGNVEPALMPLLFQHLPSGTSVANMVQWAQGIRRANRTAVHRFDYGTDCRRRAPPSSAAALHPLAAGSAAGSTVTQPRCNQEAYGTEQPPAYNLSAITTPLALFTGGRDTLSALEDVDLLVDQLHSDVVVHRHHEPDYGHMCFELGQDAHVAVYPEVLRLATQYSAST